MNEQQNTDLVKKLYAAFGRGDIQTILDNLTDDVEWEEEGPSAIPYVGKKKGRGEVAGFFQALSSGQADQKLTMDTFIAQGDQVAALGRYGASVKATGKKFDTQAAHFFTIRGGKVARFVALGDTAATVEAYTGRAAAGR